MVKPRSRKAFVNRLCDRGEGKGECLVIVKTMGKLRNAGTQTPEFLTVKYTHSHTPSISSKGDHPDSYIDMIRAEKLK